MTDQGIDTRQTISENRANEVPTLMGFGNVSKCVDSTVVARLASIKLGLILILQLTTFIPAHFVVAAAGNGNAAASGGKAAAQVHGAMVAPRPATVSSASTIAPAIAPSPVIASSKTQSTTPVRAPSTAVDSKSRSEHLRLTHALVKLSLQASWGLFMEQARYEPDLLLVRHYTNTLLADWDYSLQSGAIVSSTDYLIGLQKRNTYLGVNFKSLSRIDGLNQVLGLNPPSLTSVQHYKEKPLTFMWGGRAQFIEQVLLSEVEALQKNIAIDERFAKLLEFASSTLGADKADKFILVSLAMATLNHENTKIQKVSQTLSSRYGDDSTVRQALDMLELTSELPGIPAASLLKLPLLRQLSESLKARVVIDTIKSRAIGVSEAGQKLKSLYTWTRDLGTRMPHLTNSIEKFALRLKAISKAHQPYLSAPFLTALGGALLINKEIVTSLSTTPGSTSQQTKSAIGVESATDTGKFEASGFEEDVRQLTHWMGTTNASLGVLETLFLQQDRKIPSLVPSGDFELQRILPAGLSKAESQARWLERGLIFLKSPMNLLITNNTPGSQGPARFQVLQSAQSGQVLHITSGSQSTPGSQSPLAGSFDLLKFFIEGEYYQNYWPTPIQQTEQVLAEATRRLDSKIKLLADGDIEGFRKILLEGELQNYRGARRTILSLFLNWGGNCTTQTLLMVGLLQRYPRLIPKGFNLGAVLIPSHIEATLVSDEFVWLLVSGKKLKREAGISIITPQSLVYHIIKQIDASALSKSNLTSEQFYLQRPEAHKEDGRLLNAAATMSKSWFDRVMIIAQDPSVLVDRENGLINTIGKDYDDSKSASNQPWNDSPPKAPAYSKMNYSQSAPVDADGSDGFLGGDIAGQIHKLFQSTLTNSSTGKLGEASEKALSESLNMRRMEKRRAGDNISGRPEEQTDDLVLSHWSDQKLEQLLAPYLLSAEVVSILGSDQLVCRIADMSELENRMKLIKNETQKALNIYYSTKRLVEMCHRKATGIDLFIYGVSSFELLGKNLTAYSPALSEKIKKPVLLIKQGSSTSATFQDLPVMSLFWQSLFDDGYMNDYFVSSEFKDHRAELKSWLLGAGLLKSIENSSSVQNSYLPNSSFPNSGTTLLNSSPLNSSQVLDLKSLLSNSQLPIALESLRKIKVISGTGNSALLTWFNLHTRYKDQLTNVLSKNNFFVTIRLLAQLKKEVMTSLNVTDEQSPAIKNSRFELLQSFALLAQSIDKLATQDPASFVKLYSELPEANRLALASYFRNAHMHSNLYKAQKTLRNYLDSFSDSDVYWEQTLLNPPPIVSELDRIQLPKMGEAQSEQDCSRPDAALKGRRQYLRMCSYATGRNRLTNPNLPTDNQSAGSQLNQSQYPVSVVGSLAGDLSGTLAIGASRGQKQKAHRTTISIEGQSVLRIHPTVLIELGLATSGGVQLWNSDVLNHVAKISKSLEAAGLFSSDLFGGCQNQPCSQEFMEKLFRITSEADFTFTELEVGLSSNDSNLSIVTSDNHEPSPLSPYSKILTEQQAHALWQFKVQVHRRVLEIRFGRAALEAKTPSQPKPTPPPALGASSPVNIEDKLLERWKGLLGY
jgi:hypothetical protein